MALAYHHARPLALVRPGVVAPGPVADRLRADDDGWARYFETGYAWLREAVGFQPLFLAAGASDDDRRMTGYATQFRSRRGGELPDLVMFSWASPPPGAVHMDFHAWCSVLNHIDSTATGPDGVLHAMEPVGPGLTRGVFKRSWPVSRWLALPRREPHTVQAVAPALDLASADELWCRNQRTRRRLVAMGFAADRVHVRRLRV